VCFIIYQLEYEKIFLIYDGCCAWYLNSRSMTNTSLRVRFKMHEKQRAMISRLIKEALATKVIKSKDIKSKSSKHIEYVPYWT
jgi:ATP-dependent DNA helicase RecG